jgi:FKBP-type peptidyl-prolyl cis-trans isomerase
MHQSSTNSSAIRQAGRTSLPVVLGILAIATAIPAWVLPAMAAANPVVTVRDGGVLGRAGVGAESITGLRVVSWDDTLTAARLFEVKRVGDTWIIPSHHNYPADGNTRVTRTASGILGVPLGRLVTDKPTEHAALGVIDPLEPPAGTKSGFGKRVTLTDNTGATALDVVIGNRADSGDGVYYVREIKKNEVFTAKVDSDLSTKFVDYVEADPFKIKRDNVRGVAIVDYAVDPDKGAIQPGPYTKAMRSGSNQNWESPQEPADKRLVKTKVDDVLSELTSIRLQGVRPFDLRWLQTHGFYVGDQPQLFQLPNALTVQVQGKPYALFGTAGRLDVTTGDGLRFSFMFGKVALGDDEDKAEEDKTTEAKPDGEKKDDKPVAEGANRYVAVFVTYDAALDEESKAEAAKTEDGKPAPAKTKKLSGKERAAKAQERFQQFFYVVSNASFKKLRPDVGTWWEEKPKEPMAGNSGKTVKQWLEDNGKLPGISTTPSGLQFQILESGPADGPKPALSDQVKVAYKGTLIDGTEFDANEDMQFGVTGVIKGWTEALQLMKPGDKLKLFVPPELGYGETGSPPKIGPNQILIFEVQLKEVVGKTAKPAEAAPAPVAPDTAPAK